MSSKSVYESILSEIEQDLNESLYNASKEDESHHPKRKLIKAVRGYWIMGSKVERMANKIGSKKIWRFKSTCSED